MFRMSPSQAARFLAGWPRQITLPDVRLYRCWASLRIRVLSRCSPEIAAAAPPPAPVFVRRPAGPDVHLTAEHRLPAGVPELLNSSYLLLKSRMQRVRRGAGRNSIETPRAERRDGKRRGGRRRRAAVETAASMSSPQQQRILCSGLRRLFITDWRAGGNTEIFVRDYGEPAERSIWCGRASWQQRRHAAVRRDETSTIYIVQRRPVVVVYGRSSSLSASIWRMSRMPSFMPVCSSSCAETLPLSYPSYTPQSLMRVWSC